MKIIVFLLTVFFVDLFAISCPNSHLVLVSTQNITKAVCSTPNPLVQYGCPNSGGTSTEYIYKQRSDLCYDLKVNTWKDVSSCPTGQIKDENGVCTDPPPPPVPLKCDWATNPPYTAVPLTQDKCNNGTTMGGAFDVSYLWNFSWCSADSTCYGRQMYCPAGQVYDPLIKTCRSPSPSSGRCPAGYYKSCSSVKSVGGETCTCDYICKTNPADRTTYTVSCASGPVDKNYPITDPNAPTSSSSDGNWDHVGECFSKQSEAKYNCVAPNILSFQCDPKTGVATSSCKAPTLPSQNTPTSSDSTTNPTSKDIKDLGNSLPINIRDALKDWFTDGSMPHLEAIRGSLQALNIQTGDTNEKLVSISASTDAGLILQTDANEKLDGIKSSTNGVKDSVDNVKGSIDGLKDSVDSQKSVLDRIADFFTGSSSYNGSDMPSKSDLSPDSNTSSGFSTFTDSIQQTKDQFDQAYNLFSNGVPNITIGGGSCPSFSFFGNSYSLSKVGDAIAPYSSVFSILIYIALMFRAFRLVFSFFTKGV